MRKKTILAALAASILVGGLAISQGNPGDVTLHHKGDEHQIEVRIGSELFTSYRYGPEFDQKPVFYPVLSPGGQVINRELPFLNPNTDETTDHPHHQSVYLGYGDVNGYDFWSSRDGEKIVHQALLDWSSGGEEAQLSLLLEWVTPEGKSLVEEVRRVTFGRGAQAYWMDHDIVLRSLGETLAFNDTKEGMFALRLTDALREDEGTGKYENAFGWETSAEVWGKRSPYMILRGEVEGEEVTVAFFDHPSTKSYPSYWHARGYGLFAVNPFGRKDFVEGAEAIDRKLEPYESFHFRYRIVIYQGKRAKKEIDRDYWEYIQ